MNACRSTVPIRIPTAQLVWLGFVLAVVGANAVPVQAAMDCQSTAAALEYWRPIREQAIASSVPGDEFAIELLDCLGSPNPELRDRIAYELYALWLRGERLTDETRRELFRELLSKLAGPVAATADNTVFARSFAALILAEIMRSDAVQPFLSDAERQELLDQAMTGIGQENDYRGLVEDLGWVHPVAHMSDLLWRFALHPGTSAEQAEAILAAVRSKVAPTAVFYGFNESDRLARVVTTLVVREILEPSAVATWIESFGAPSSMAKWSDAFASPQGMAELHNTKLFLRALSDQLDGEEIDPLIAAPLAEFVQGFTQLI